MIAHRSVLDAPGAGISALDLGALVWVAIATLGATLAIAALGVALEVRRARRDRWDG